MLKFVLVKVYFLSCTFVDVDMAVQKSIKRSRSSSAAHRDKRDELEKSAGVPDVLAEHVKGTLGST